MQRFGVFGFLRVSLCTSGEEMSVLRWESGRALCVFCFFMYFVSSAGCDAVQQYF